MKTMNWQHLLVLAVALTMSSVVGCAKKEAPVPEAAEPVVVQEASVGADEAATRAQAKLELGADRVDAGAVLFELGADGVRITAHIVGAPPGVHGLHVHELGDCSAEDFTSAGGHFNPTDAPHGSPEDAERHAGDLGNIVIGADGSGHLELVSTMLSIDEGDNAVVGRGVILHAKEDDLKSQPTGAAGARLACGVVLPI